MHDPNTLAFDIHIGGVRLFEIWHVDPEKDGDDDSCGWGWPKLSESEIGLAYSLMHNEYDNLRSWYDGVPDYTAESRIRQLFRIHKRHVRPWWKHPRWHAHHWEIKVVPVEKLKRWLFSRCAYCGRRFKWGYAPLSTMWHNDGPRWFSTEKNLYHHDCYADKKHKEQTAKCDGSPNGGY